MPGITKTVSTSIVQRITSSPLSLVTLFYTSFITLELLDRFNLFSIGPLCLGTGYLVTVAYQRARALAVPLWFSKQVARFGAFSILTLLFSGYCMLAREMQVAETRVVLTNIQRELDGQRPIDNNSEDALARKSELARLKDPFI